MGFGTGITWRLYRTAQLQRASEVGGGISGDTLKLILARRNSLKAFEPCEPLTPVAMRQIMKTIFFWHWLFVSRKERGKLHVWLNHSCKTNGHRPVFSASQQFLRSLVLFCEHPSIHPHTHPPQIRVSRSLPSYWASGNIHNLPAEFSPGEWWWSWIYADLPASSKLAVGNLETGLGPLCLRWIHPAVIGQGKYQLQEMQHLFGNWVGIWPYSCADSVLSWVPSSDLAYNGLRLLWTSPW